MDAELLSSSQGDTLRHLISQDDECVPLGVVWAWLGGRGMARGPVFRQQLCDGRVVCLLFFFLSLFFSPFPSFFLSLLVGRRYVFAAYEVYESDDNHDLNELRDTLARIARLYRVRGRASGSPSSSPVQPEAYPTQQLEQLIDFLQQRNIVHSCTSVCMWGQRTRV